ncbi:DUF1684 domain-containing protein (plasmid) [Haladaptatus sp. SPP-AMP-3]|uniref:DUF1684 domain-containing protein n=1 Tax=Haladaptatus sp. SPP-AMP-3 TaxID=3121295 RepID=UPI003C2DA583
MADWTAELEQERAEKDEFFAKHPRSPIPVGERESFDGLDYYPPDEDLRFELELAVFDDHEEITVETTQDGAQGYLRWGEFRFTVGGAECTLTAFKAEQGEERLWVPFRDETNGEETYPAGRYLDLESEDRTADGKWVLDFNRAYSPFCAYSEAYECPLVPMENWLDVSIEAGERFYEH